MASRSRMKLEPLGGWLQEKLDNQKPPEVNNLRLPVAGDDLGATPESQRISQ